jgi:hypothetical protein
MGHGEGENNGMGACVKQALKWYQMSHDVFQIKSSIEVIN